MYFIRQITKNYTTMWRKQKTPRMWGMMPTCILIYLSKAYSSAIYHQVQQVQVQYQLYR